MSEYLLIWILCVYGPNYSCIQHQLTIAVPIFPQQSGHRLVVMDVELIGRFGSASPDGSPNC